MNKIKKKSEIITVKEFMKLLLNRKGTTSEHAIFSFFNKHLQAYEPITAFSEFLKSKKILIVYGEEDWSPISHAEEVCRYFIILYQKKCLF